MSGIERRVLYILFLYTTDYYTFQSHSFRSHHILWQRSLMKGDLIPLAIHHWPKLCVEITGLLLPKTAILGVSESWFPAAVDSVLGQAPVEVSLEDPGLLSPLMAPSFELLSSFTFAFFLSLDLLFWNHIFTWVCVSPRKAASSARSGRARYWVFWKRFVSSRSWKLE